MKLNRQFLKAAPGRLFLMMTKGGCDYETKNCVFYRFDISGDGL
jgi:hypothetical protein